MEGNLAASYIMQGRLDEALEHCESGRALLRELGSRDAEVPCLSNAGGIYHSMGLHQLAREQFARAGELEQELGRGASWGAGGMAIVIGDAGDPAEAARLLRAHVATLRERGANLQIPMCLKALGSFAAELGQEEEAVDIFEQAIALAREVDRPQTLALALVGRAALPDGDTDAALAEYLEVEPRVSVAVKKEARFALWQQTGDRAHVEEAKRLLDFLVDHAPEEHRAAFLANERKIVEAYGAG